MARAWSVDRSDANACTVIHLIHSLPRRAALRLTLSPPATRLSSSARNARWQARGGRRPRARAACTHASPTPSIQDQTGPRHTTETETHAQTNDDDDDQATLDHTQRSLNYHLHICISPPRRPAMSHTQDPSVADDELKPSQTEGYKVGDKKTVEEYAQMDANDESLQVRGETSDDDDDVGGCVGY